MFLYYKIVADNKTKVNTQKRGKKIVTEIEKWVLSPAEVAVRLDCEVRTIYRELKKGKIPYVKVGDKYLIPKIAFEKWLAGNSSK